MLQINHMTHLIRILILTKEETVLTENGEVS